MPTDIRSLWSNLIKPGILSPLAILKSQGEALKEQTNGILVPEIDTEEYLPRIKHTLAVVVPALDGFRYSVMQIAHHKEQPYPVFSLGPGLAIWEDYFNSYVRQGELWVGDYRADNQDEFIELLSVMFQNSSLVGNLQSLIARVTEI